MTVSPTAASRSCGARRFSAAALPVSCEALWSMPCSLLMDQHHDNTNYHNHHALPPTYLVPLPVCRTPTTHRARGGGGHFHPGYFEERKKMILRVPRYRYRYGLHHSSPPTIQLHPSMVAYVPQGGVGAWVGDRSQMDLGQSAYLPTSRISCNCEPAVQAGTILPYICLRSWPNTPTCLPTYFKIDNT